MISSKYPLRKTLIEFSFRSSPISGPLLVSCLPLLFGILFENAFIFEVKSWRVPANVLRLAWLNLRVPSGDRKQDFSATSSKFSLMGEKFLMSNPWLLSGVVNRRWAEK